MSEEHDDGFRDLTIEGVCQGAIPELFDAELKRVVENILDPNTHPTEAREIQLSIKIKPSKEGRASGRIEVSAKSKLAGSLGTGAAIYMGRRRGEVVATTYDPRQLQMQWEEEGKPKPLRRPQEDDEDRAAANE